MEEFLCKKRGRSVSLHLPEKGKHLRILQMAYENAAMDIEKRYKRVANIEGLKELQSVLSLKKLPRRIEGF
ncbi:MAG: excinuclease ABC subunit C, partial [Spirochaetales bacterium]|nr:excinuclease ABC subunit C [Spirochaetales bacterium]